MKSLFIGLTIATILSQIPHAFFTFNSFSRLDGWMRNTQSWVFCWIISIAIFGFVMIDRSELAIFGAIIEIVINIYYYSKDFWKEGYGQKQKDGRKKSRGKFWRQNWIAMFFGVLIPVMIYVFSDILKNYE